MHVLYRFGINLAPGYQIPDELAANLGKQRPRVGQNRGGVCQGEQWWGNAAKRCDRGASLCETDVDAPRGQAQAGTSQVKLWTNTDSPHQVETGTLVRLGPTYVTRDEHSFAELAQRFNTNEWALVEMNPDLSALAADNARIPAGQEICVLPGICTAAAGAELDRGGDV